MLPVHTPHTARRYFDGLAAVGSSSVLKIGADVICFATRPVIGSGLLVGNFERPDRPSRAARTCDASSVDANTAAIREHLLHQLAGHNAAEDVHDDFADLRQ
eukprot:scaffold2191_cov254-Pinguiococcus_pyrenoidosus.AAC.2